MAITGKVGRWIYVPLTSRSQHVNQVISDVFAVQGSPPQGRARALLMFLILISCDLLMGDLLMVCFLSVLITPYWSDGHGSMQK